MNVDAAMMSEIQRAAKIELGKKHIWDYCQLKAPKFYADHKWFLKDIADTMEDVIYGKRINPKTNRPYRKVMINCPPQLGKSRTITLAMEWILGKMPDQRIIYASYNDKVASKFSGYVRNGIMEEKLPKEKRVIFKDLFPDVKLAVGNKSVQRWALDGQHFNFLACGVGGSATSEGGSIIIIDDPVKSAAEAFNQLELERKWEWYSGTIMSRVSAETLDPVEIIVMTRWSKNDICGKLLEIDEKGEWLVITLEAFSEKNIKRNKRVFSKSDIKAFSNDEMKLLSPYTFTLERYNYLKKYMPEEIFLANYHQQTIDKKNLLYEEFKTYDLSADIEFDTIKAYCDLAGKGSDYFVGIIYGVRMINGGTYYYVLDVLMSNKGYKYTMDEYPKRHVKYNVKRSTIEGNHGDAFLTSVEEKTQKLGNKFCQFVSRFESSNKEQKILQYAPVVNERIIMPEDWRLRFPEFYNHVTFYQKKGKNPHDDPEDVLSNMAREMIVESNGSYENWIRSL